MVQGINASLLPGTRLGTSPRRLGTGCFYGPASHLPALVWPTVAFLGRPNSLIRARLPVGLPFHIPLVRGISPYGVPLFVHLILEKRIPPRWRRPLSPRALRSCTCANHLELGSLRACGGAQRARRRAAGHRILRRQSALVQVRMQQHLGRSTAVRLD
jgi:hypothetical protein